MLRSRVDAADAIEEISHAATFYGTQLGRKGTQMSDQYPFRTKIEQILRKNTRSHFAKRFLGMQKGLTDAEMAEEAVRTGCTFHARVTLCP